MPTVSIYLIRSAFIYLILGIGIGTLLLIDKGFSFAPQIWFLLPIHIELLLSGWLLQFLMGVAYWMFPKFITGKTRGNKNVAVTMFILYNLGMIALLSAHLVTELNSLLILGRVLHFSSISCFVFLIWSRITTYNR